jgi:hypothetical protein
VLGTDGALEAGAAIAEALDDGALDDGALDDEALATDAALAVIATGFADEPLPHPAAKTRIVTGNTNARRESRTKSTERLPDRVRANARPLVQRPRCTLSFR